MFSNKTPKANFEIFAKMLFEADPAMDIVLKISQNFQNSTSIEHFIRKTSVSSCFSFLFFFVYSVHGLKSKELILNPIIPIVHKMVMDI